MIDLHTHTDESDGSLSPAELVGAARAAGLETLGITDHDTFTGYYAAQAPAAEAGLELICGIELSTTFRRRTVHLLGYFPDSGPGSAILERLAAFHASRRDRNRRLAARLAELGVPVGLDEVEHMGRSIAGRPHFAKLMVKKGYVRSSDEAFRLYLAEGARAYVERDSPSVAEGIRCIHESGGISSLAHPIRLGYRNPEDEERVIATFVDAGLDALEVHHSDHSPDDERRYAGLAGKYGVGITGGSDFHGEAKPDVTLGIGLSREQFQALAVRGLAK